MSKLSFRTSRCRYLFLRVIVSFAVLWLVMSLFALYSNDKPINPIILIVGENHNKNGTCGSKTAFAHRLLMINNGFSIVTNDTLTVVLNLQLPHVGQVTGIMLDLGPPCSDCDDSNIEVRVGYDSSNSKNNAVCYYSQMNRKKKKNSIYLVCYTCPLYGDRVNIGVSGNYTGLKMKNVTVYGYDAPSQCAVKPQCKGRGDGDAWHRWIDNNTDLNHVFEPIVYKYLHPWLSLSARKLHGLGDKGHVQPLKLYVEYPLISPLDIASIFGQHPYIYCCRVRWNQRYLDATGEWRSKPTFNSSHVESINSPHLSDRGACDEVLKQFRFIVDHLPRQSLPEYMDIIYQFGDDPKMPLSHLSRSDEQNKQRSQTESLLPYWLTQKSGFLGGIDYYTLNYTIPLLDIPPPMLSHCTTDQHIDIPWFYFQKWIHDPTEKFLKALSLKTTQLEDCSSMCDPFYEWHTRRRQATWRGSLTAVYPNIKLAGNWRYHQRVALREQSIQHPGPLDVQIAHCAHCSNETRRALIDSLGSFVETDGKLNYGHYYPSYLFYQGLIDIDGVTWSSRFYQLLAQGAVVFKQNTEYKEWWTDLLIPGTHYIPLSYDMLDTATIVQSTLADEQRSQSIAQNGVRFVATYLQSKSWLKYSQIFLNAYSALLIKPWQNHSRVDIHYLFEHAERIRQEHKPFRAS